MIFLYIFLGVARSSALSSTFLNSNIFVVLHCGWLGLNHQDRRVSTMGDMGGWNPGSMEINRHPGMHKISPKCWLSNSFPTSSSCARRWCLSLCPASAGRSFRASWVRVTSRDFEKRYPKKMDWRFGAQKNWEKNETFGPLGPDFLRFWMICDPESWSLGKLRGLQNISEYLSR